MKNKPKTVYLIGSLRNPKIPYLARRLRRATGFEIFDNWFSGGRIADQCWREYSNIKGLTYQEALNSYEARNVFLFDKTHIDRSDMGLLVLPCGRSGHLEAGYMRGCGKPVVALLDRKQKRYDVMYQFLSGIFFSERELIKTLKKTV